MDKNYNKYNTIWQEIISVLKETNKISASFIERVAFNNVESNKFIIASTSNFISSYFEKSKNFINEKLKEFSNEELFVEFITKSIDYVDNLNANVEKNQNDDDEDNELPQEEIVKVQPSSRIINTNTSNYKPSNSFVNNKNDFNDIKIEKVRDSRRISNLNERYTFDTFIYGENTTFTYNIAYTIAKNPGITYNPCLIYGGVGLGKTHLLQSIGNYICQNSTRLKVIYVTAEAFTNEFISALRKDQIGSFKNKYRKVDVLLIDDIHFLQNKESTQEELFHTFNDLYETKRQMVFTCDRPISELKNITDRLLSRFGRGMNIDLKPPTYETKFAILKQKSIEQNIKLNDKVIDYLCLNINTNVRDLEAALTKLGAFQSFIKTDISVEKAMELIAPSASQLEKERVNFSVDEIIRETANYYELSHYDLKSRKRTRKFVVPRQIAIYISRMLTDLSTTEIGSDFSRDHTTIMHAIEKVESDFKANPEVAKSIKDIIERLKTKS
ncbi:MAG: chromosomal replication initiator protein DnaA [Spirochaetaceae bacterium]|nr:chromosomal replication initiator protein DnaA [Spirochaetaceae bacterium]